MKKGKCDEEEYFDLNLNKCVDNDCPKFSHYYSESLRRCERKPTCVINQVFNEKTEKCENKKCKPILEY